MIMHDMLLHVKEITFDAAHYIPGYRGKCAGIHGHTYYIRDLSISFAFVDTLSKRGIAIDFKKIKGYFDDEWDHKFVVPEDHYMFLEKMFMICDFPEELDPPLVSNLKPIPHTTAEGMAAVIAEDLLCIAIEELYDGVMPEDERDIPEIHFGLYEGPGQGVLV